MQQIVRVRIWAFLPRENLLVERKKTERPAGGGRQEEIVRPWGKSNKREFLPRESSVPNIHSWSIQVREYSRIFMNIQCVEWAGPFPEYSQCRIFRWIFRGSVEYSPEFLWTFTAWWGDLNIRNTSFVAIMSAHYIITDERTDCAQSNDYGMILIRWTDIIATQSYS